MNNKEMEYVKDLLETHTTYINKEINRLSKKLDAVCAQITNNKKEIEQKIEKVEKKTRWYKTTSFAGGAFGGFLAIFTKGFFWGGK